MLAQACWGWLGSWAPSVVSSLARWGWLGSWAPSVVSSLTRWGWLGSCWPHTCEDRVELSCLCTADLCGQCRAYVLMSCTRISPTIRPETPLASLAWKAL